MWRRIVLLLFALLPLVIGASLSRADQQEPSFILSWSFRNWGEDPTGDLVYIYTPGETAVLQLNLSNDGELTLDITYVTLVPEWAGGATGPTLTLNPPVKVRPGETAELGELRVEIPVDLRPGVYTYEFWVGSRTPDGTEWRSHVEGFRNLIVAPARALVVVDYDTKQGFTFRAGGEVTFVIHLKNEGGAETRVEYVRIYTGWPEETYSSDEFFSCLEPGSEPTLPPGGELSLECKIPIPPDLPEGRYESSLEVKTVTSIMGKSYAEYWIPDYVVDYQVAPRESFVQRYKEALGLLTATASAVSVLIGVYKKWKGGEKGG